MIFFQTPDKVSGNWTCPVGRMQAGCAKKRASPKSFNRVGKPKIIKNMKQKNAKFSDFKKNVWEKTALSYFGEDKAVSTSDFFIDNDVISL